MSDVAVENKPSFFKPLAPVLLTVLIDLLGFGLVIPLMNFYAEDYHATKVEVTALMASYSLAQFLFQPMWGAISDRIGRRPVMLVSIAGTAICLGGFAHGGSLVALFVWRTLHGACAANISTAQAYVADVTRPEDRAKGMGLIGASFGIGFTFGPLLGGFMATNHDYSRPIWFAAGLAAFNFFWTLARLPESRKPGSAAATSERTLDPRVLIRGVLHPIVGLTIVLTFCVTFAFSMMETSFGLVAEHAWNLDPAGVGGMLGLIGIVGILVQGGLIGRLAKKYGESRLAVLGLALTALGLFVMTLAALGHEPLRWPAACLLALGTSLTNPSLSSLISRGVGPDEQGSILGANQSLSALARATAPTIGGWLIQTFNLGSAFLAGGVLLVGATLLALPATRRAKSGQA